MPAVWHLLHLSSDMLVLMTSSVEMTLKILHTNIQHMSARRFEALESRLASLQEQFYTLLDVFLREQRKIEREHRKIEQLTARLNIIEKRKQSRRK